MEKEEKDQMHERPTINEIVGSIITIIAVLTVMYLAANGDDGSKTALITLTGAAAGMYYQNKNSGGNRPIRRTSPSVKTVKPVVPRPAGMTK